MTEKKADSEFLKPQSHDGKAALDEGAKTQQLSDDGDGDGNAASEAHKPQTAQGADSNDGDETAECTHDESPPVAAPTASDDFPVVGIGASAGGLEAFERFFTAMPPDTGVAFVIIQHLDPKHKSILPELLRGFTRMPVREPTHGMAIEPNSVYVIAPGKDMTIRDGRLYLEAQPDGRPRHPIDRFFRSLAEYKRDKAIEILLSGAAAEGTLGLTLLKGEGGMIMVQDPSSAKFDGMPRSAIATRLVDIIAPPSQMAGELIAYLKHPLRARTAECAPVDELPSDYLQKIFALVKHQTRHDFSRYKHSTIMRRAERRMAVKQISSYKDYVTFLQGNPSEVETLFFELLIGVTSFFRDSEAFEVLKTDVLTPLVKNATSRGSVRVWVPGCSTGEEAYSIAILLQEVLDQMQVDIDIQIFATDIDKNAIEKARTGAYPLSAAADIEPERLQRFFVQRDNLYYVKKAIREMVVFADQNVITDPPFSKLNLVSCRNLLIYLGADLQKKVFPIFHFALNKDGCLFLGTSETTGEFSDLFITLDRKWKIFGRREVVGGKIFTTEFSTSRLSDSAPLLENKSSPPLPAMADYREIAERALLDNYGALGVLFNEHQDVLYFHGATGKFLQPPTGEVSWNLLGMAREGLRIHLANAIRKASAYNEPARRRNIEVKADGGVMLVNLTVRPILDPPARRGLMFAVFEEVRDQEGVPATESPEPAENENTIMRVRQLEHELMSTKEYLQTAIEEFETANEELKSTNEELQSANEELQSTNEELEMADEEQQSINEELNTVNAELQNKIDALSKVNNDMNILLASTQIGTIFLDTDLNIQRFTPTVTKIINLIQTDIGRPISHIVSNLHYDNLVTDVHNVLTDLASKKMEVQTKSGDWYFMSILPYRTTENVIEGVAVTFVDISERKKIEETAQLGFTLAVATLECSRSPMALLDTQGTVISTNRRFTEMFGEFQEDASGKRLYQHSHQGTFALPSWKTLLKELLPNHDKVNNFSIRDDSTSPPTKLIVNARLVQTEPQASPMIIVSVELGPQKNDNTLD